MSTATSLITIEEFEQLPQLDEPGKHELIDGELVSMPLPELSYQELSQRILRLLLNRHLSKIPASIR